MASESVALDALGFKLLRDVAPGEAVLIDDGRQFLQPAVRRQSLAQSLHFRICLSGAAGFGDRRHFGVRNAGCAWASSLAEKIRRDFGHLEIDVVIPIPDTSRPSALQLANQLGLPYREGFIKNRYIGRTFIMPGQALRKKSVRQKLNAIGMEFKGKNVLLVDDSIVRGTTSREIVQMAREAGANKVYLRLGRAAGALSQRLWHRHADARRN